MSLRSIGLFLIIGLLFLNISFSKEKQHFSITSQPSSAKVKKGESFTVRVTIKFDDTWYTYDVKEQLSKDGIGPTPTEFSILPDDKVEISGKVITPEAHKKFDEGFEINISYFNGEAVFELPVKAKKDLDFSKDKIETVVYMQLCDPTKCLPPEEYKSVVLSEPFGENLWSLLTLALSLGFVSIFTPCVYPMIPITVSFFTKRTETTKGKGLRDAFLYAIGIIATYTVIGVLAASLFGAAGIQSFATSPGVYLFMTILFLVFALSLFGAFEIQMPTGLMNKLNMKSQQGSGISSVLLMGLTFALASFSCTGPLVGYALTNATQGQWLSPVIIMLGFSTVLASPFFILALVPALLKSMPKAGGWMNNMKVVLGFVVIITTMYFFNNALLQWDSGLSREIFLSIWIACFILMTLYILGVFKMKLDTPLDQVGSPRVFIAMIFATITIYLFSGLFGADLGELETYIPQSKSASLVNNSTNMQGIGAEQVETIQWLDNYQSAVAKAKEEGKPIFIDFTGKTCTNCKKMEKRIFPLASIQELFGKMITVKLYVDYPENRQLQQQRFNKSSQPFYVILTPDEEIIATEDFNDDENEFKAFLNKAFN